MRKCSISVANSRAVNIWAVVAEYPARQLHHMAYFFADTQEQALAKMVIKLRCFPEWMGFEFDNVDYQAVRLNSQNSLII